MHQQGRQGVEDAEGHATAFATEAIRQGANETTADLTPGLRQALRGFLEASKSKLNLEAKGLLRLHSPPQREPRSLKPSKGVQAGGHDRRLRVSICCIERINIGAL